MGKKPEFALADLTVGQLNAVVKKLGGYEGALRFLRGEIVVLKPTRAWREQDGVIYIEVTSDGTTGEAWIPRLEEKGNRVSDYAKSVLRSPDFHPTKGVTYRVAVLKGLLFTEQDRITKLIRAEAANRKFVTPNAEVACLIREKFTDKELEAMGLVWVVVMHEPIKDSDGGPFLLDVGRYDSGRWLSTYYGCPGVSWRRNDGFAFLASQV